MKGIMAAIALLAMVNTSWAAEYTLLGPGSVPGGIPFHIQIGLHTEGALFDAWEFSFTAPAEMQVVSHAYLGDWDTIYVMDVDPGPLNGIYPGSFREIGASIDGPVLDIEIAGLPEGDYTIVMDYGIGMYWGEYVATSLAPPLLISVIPEPTTALLLLAGLPLLRRKR